MRILLIGARLHRNFAGPALLESTLAILRRTWPEAQYRILVPAPTYDRSLLSEYEGIEIQPMPRPWHPLRLLRALNWPELVVDIFGLMFADTLGSTGFLWRGKEGLHLGLAKLLGKKVVKATADFGPCRTLWNRLFARLYLKRVDRIMARSVKSKTELEAIGVKTSIVVAPDTAFLLPGESGPAPAGGASVGISVSYQAARRHPDYVGIMAAFARRLVLDYGAFVVLIPNEFSGGDRDDGRIAWEIEDRVHLDQCRTCICKTWPASRIKGTIAACDVLVAARYHSVVAALSCGVPTLAIGWHHKYRAVMGLFGQEDRVIDIENLRLPDLLDQFDKLWQNRKAIRAQIEARQKEVEDAVVKGFAQWMSPMI